MYMCTSHVFAGNYLTVLWKIYGNVDACTDSVYQALLSREHGFKASANIALYPGHEGGGKMAWYLLYVHASTFP